MPDPALYKYLDFGERAMSDLGLRSGERVFVSLLPNGMAVHRTHLRGMIPGRRLFAAATEDVTRMARALARAAASLPPLPKAIGEFRDDSAMMEFLDAATADIKAMTDKDGKIGRVDAVDLENRAERPLSLFSRLALTADDVGDLSRRFQRTANIPG